MPQIQGVIESVQSRPAGGTTIYDVMIGGQAYSTFDPDVAKTANERIGQNGSWEVNIKPSKDGRFTNFYYEGPANGAAPQQLGIAAAATPMQPQLPVQPAIPHVAPQAGGMTPERERKIVKQSCMATAFNFIGHLWNGAGPEGAAEAEAQAMELAKRLYLQVLGSPQTLDDQIVQQLAQAPPPPPQPETDW